MLRRLYDWTLHLSAHPRAAIALAAVAFVESSVFPIPPDVILGPMVLARRERAFRYALLCTAFSVLGAFLGYAIGHFLFAEVGKPVLAFYGYTAEFETFREAYNAWGAWAVLMAGVTPFPFKVITILSGTTGLNLGVFTVSAVVARGVRFFIVAGLFWLFGPPIREFVEKRLGLVFFAFFILLIGGILAVRTLF